MTWRPERVEQIVPYFKTPPDRRILWILFFRRCAMQVLNPHCCGLDVHKELVVACVRHVRQSGDAAERQEISEEVRSFGTTTRDLLALSDWLAAQGVTIAAMESTGVFWKPVWNLLEGRMKLMLVNARHMKQVPGRKTDVKDCQWIAQLLGCGLLTASFVPERPQRELRDLTRQRAQLIQDCTRVANRIQKVLEDANIKLGSVASDVLGVSGREMIRALIAGGQSPEQMADLARQQLRKKIPQLIEALRGGVTEHHRFMLQRLMGQVEYIELDISRFDERIEAVMSPLEKQAVATIDGVVGFDIRAAQNVIAEIGCDMTRFATSGHLASWAGVCPGNNLSAGKRRSGRMTEGNRWLKRTLAQSAWAAARSVKSYFRVQHRRIASRRGAKRATMAVAHSQLCVIYELLAKGQTYQDMGPDYFARLDEERNTRRLVAGLERMGYQVSIAKAA
jgi:transposase